MVDNEFNIKLIGFGNARKLDCKEKENWKNGITNECHLAPEIFFNQSFHSQQADLFASGIFLFVILSIFPPFYHAKQSDFYYKYILHNKEAKFWEIHSKSLEEYLNLD